MSRYKYDRSRELITGYKVGSGHWSSVAVQIVPEPENCQGVLGFNCGQMRVSGCKSNYKIVLRAGTKAKSVTNNLPILSVLADGFYFFCNKLSKIFFGVIYPLGLDLSVNMLSKWISSILS